MQNRRTSESCYQAHAEFVYVIEHLLPITIVINENKKKKEKERRLAIATNYMIEVQRVLEKASTLKTTGAKLNNYVKAEKLLLGSQGFKECGEVVKNYDEILDRVPRMRKVLPAISAVEKSYRHRFKKKHNLELNSLLDAIYEIRSNDITNEDFSVAMIMPEGTGEIVTIEGIESRLGELGWKEDGFKTRRT